MFTKGLFTHAIEYENFVDSKMMPGGGYVKGPGMYIAWENNNPAPRQENCKVDDVLLASVIRLQFLQTLPSAPPEYEEVLINLRSALKKLGDIQTQALAKA